MKKLFFVLLMMLPVAAFACGAPARRSSIRVAPIHAHVPTYNMVHIRPDTRPIPMPGRRA